jgi:hypothetical protein
MADKSEVEKDLERWFRDRISQVALDCHMRCRAMGVDPKSTAAMIGSTLFEYSVRLMAEWTDAKPEWLGAHFASGVKLWRERANDERQEQHKGSPQQESK